MVEGKAFLGKDPLWAAGLAAFMVHSLAFSALALVSLLGEGRGVNVPGVKDCFKAEILFVQEPSENTSSQATLVSFSPSEVKNATVTPPGAIRLASKKGLQKRPIRASPGLPSSAPSGGGGNGVPLFNPAPAYPLAARRNKIEGVVYIRLSLTEAGSVGKASPLLPRIDPILEEAALTAVYQWKFTPGARTVDVPIEFKLV